VLMIRDVDDQDALPYTPVAYLGVRPGDRLNYGGWRAPEAEYHEVSVPPFDGATEYRYHVDCGLRSDFGIVDAVPFQAPIGPCEAPALMIKASNDAGPLALIAIDGFDASMDLVSDAAWVLPTPMELVLRGIDPSAETVQLQAWEAIRGARVPTNTGGTGIPSAGRYQVNGLFAAAPGVSVFVQAVRNRMGYLAKSNFATAPYAADLSVDIADVAMPWIARPLFDAETRTLAWTQDGEGSVDAVVGYLSFRRGGATFYWSFGTDALAMSAVTLPVLPAPWTDYNPRPEDDWAGEESWLRGDGIGELARTDPGKLAWQAAWLGYISEPPISSFGMIFNRTFLP
jgi:hypothetical protein